MDDSATVDQPPAAGGWLRATGRGRPREVDLREVVNAVWYVLHEGCRGRSLPHDFPPWPTVSWYFAKWADDDTLVRIQDALRRRVRQAAGREPEPSALIIDSQSVKATGKGDVGYDAGKRVKGTKRFIAVVTNGLLVRVAVLQAGVPDWDGLLDLCQLTQPVSPRVTAGWVDRGFTAGVAAARDRFGWDLTVVSKQPGQHGFQAQPRRWVVERTFCLAHRLSPADHGL